jgi:hypothetical protein
VPRKPPRLCQNGIQVWRAQSALNQKQEKRRLLNSHKIIIKKGDNFFKPFFGISEEETATGAYFYTLFVVVALR